MESWRQRVAQRVLELARAPVFAETARLLFPALERTPNVTCLSRNAVSSAFTVALCVAFDEGGGELSWGGVDDIHFQEPFADSEWGLVGCVYQVLRGRGNPLFRTDWITWASRRRAGRSTRASS